MRNVLFQSPEVLSNRAKLITFTWKIKVLLNGLTSIDTSDEWAVARYSVIVGNEHRVVMSVA